ILFSLVMCVRVAVGAGAAEPSTAGRPTGVRKPCPYPVLAVAAVAAAGRKEDGYLTATSPSWNRTRAWNRTDRRVVQPENKRRSLTRVTKPPRSGGLTVQGPFAPPSEPRRRAPGTRRRTPRGV